MEYSNNSEIIQTKYRDYKLRYVDDFQVSLWEAEKKRKPTTFNKIPSGTIAKCIKKTLENIKVILK